MRLPESVPVSPADLSEDLLLARDGDLAVYFAPFDYVNIGARIAIVGITPGLQQMQIAYRAGIEAQRAGASPMEVSLRAKTAASFAGSMRTNLNTMLDGIGIAGHLGLSTCGQLFDSRAELLHTTSALRYPVFKAGKNYTGHGPAPTENATLRRMIDEQLAPELEAVANALIVPLGKSVCGVMEYLTEAGKLDAGRWLRDFPHPSGANGHRARQFDQHRKTMAQQVAAWFV